MRIAITGGTGFVGSHLAERLLDADHEVLLLARGEAPGHERFVDRDGVSVVSGSVTDRNVLERAVEGCDALAHLAGINHERGEQTYEAVHVEGTRNAVRAAESADVSTLALTSFLRARPNTGSGYHDSKWTSEVLVRESPVDHLVVKPGIVYGRGDQMLTQLTRSLRTVPFFPRVGLRDRRHRPLAVEDLVDVLFAGLVEGRLRNITVPVLGPESLTLSAMVRRVADAANRRVLSVPAPVAFHRLNAWGQEQVMAQPIVTSAGVRMLAEGTTEPAPAAVCEPLPSELEPSRSFRSERLADRLPEAGRFGLSDLRL